MREGCGGVGVLLVSHWGHMGSYSSSPFTDICWSSFLLHKLAFADWIKKATLSSIVSDTLVTSQKLLGVLFKRLSSFTNGKTCRALFMLARTSGTHPLQKDSIFSVNVEEKLAQTSSDLFQHCLWYFVLFALGEICKYPKAPSVNFRGSAGISRVASCESIVILKKIIFFKCRGR